MSSITGQGFDGFYTAMKKMTQDIQPRSTEGIFRMPVERMFSVKGFGTVISGIPASGSAKKGDELTLLPSGDKSRIKAIQVYGQDAEVVQSGQCAALNLPQLDFKVVERGNVLTTGDYFQPSQWLVCKLKMLTGQTLRLKNGDKVKFHTGTSETTATVYLLESDLVTASQKTIVQIRTDHPIIVGPCDCYILRDLSPVRTIAGGMVIETLGHKLKRTKEGLQRDIQRRSEAVCNTESFVEYCIEFADDFATNINDIALRVKLQPEKVQEICNKLTANERIIPLTTHLYMHRDIFSELSRMIVYRTEQFHKAHPESPGLTKEQLFQKQDVKKAVIEGICKNLLNNKRLVLRKECFALLSHSETFDPKQQELLTKIENLFKDQLFTPPKIEDLPGLLQCSIEEANATVKILIEQQSLVRVERDLYFHSDAIKEAKCRTIEYIQTEGKGQLESVKFKYLLDTTRKFAIPMLDYMDKIGVTRRVGNTRYLK
jgi:selenocysteine-specific elongation factor